MKLRLLFYVQTSNIHLRRRISVRMMCGLGSVHGYNGPSPGAKVPIARDEKWPTESDEACRNNPVNGQKGNT